MKTLETWQETKEATEHVTGSSPKSSTTSSSSGFAKLGTWTRSQPLICFVTSKGTTDYVLASDVTEME